MGKNPDPEEIAVVTNSLKSKLVLVTPVPVNFQNGHSGVPVVKHVRVELLEDIKLIIAVLII